MANEYRINNKTNKSKLALKCMIRNFVFISLYHDIHNIALLIIIII